jgi:hypothetical protein
MKEKYISIYLNVNTVGLFFSIQPQWASKFRSIKGIKALGLPFAALSKHSPDRLGACRRGRKEAYEQAV